MCFQLVRPPPEPARSLTSPLRCTSSSHLCWQRSKDRSEQRLSARAVLIGGSCSLKRLLNNVKKLRRIFKSLLSEPSYPSSSLAPPTPSPRAPAPGRCVGPKRCHFVTLLGQKPLSRRRGPGDTAPSLFQPKGRVVAGLRSREGVSRTPPPAAAPRQLQPAASQKKSHRQSWFQGKHSEMPKLALRRANTSPWVSGVVPGVFPTLTAPRTPCSAAGPRRRHGHEPWDGLVRRASVPLPCLPAILMARREKQQQDLGLSSSQRRLPGPCFSQLNGSRAQHQPEKSVKGKKNKYCETRGCRNQLQLPTATCGCRGRDPLGGRGERAEAASPLPAPFAGDRRGVLPWVPPAGAVRSPQHRRSSAR